MAPVILAIVLLLAPSPALAGPVGAAIAAVVSFISTSAVGAFLFNVAVSVGLNLLARALAPKPKAPQAGEIVARGIQTVATTTGGTTPQAFPLGLYATGGHMVAPPYSHGTVDETPNAYLNYIIELSDVPGVALSRLIVNDDYVTLGGTPNASYGSPILKFRRDGTDHAWIRFYDGTQTSADPMLVSRYGSHPERPWTSSAVGNGTAYAILTFLYDRELFNSLPRVRFEMLGIPLYDPRKDSTVGGDGAHRHTDVSTWEFSDNPAVMIYNLLRGIPMPDGSIYGGKVAGANLPLGNWFAAMNACDEMIGGRKQFRAGFEVDVTVEPASVVDELLKVCVGQISEWGGVYRIRIGPPAAAVLSITDDDISVSDTQELDPFPGLEQTVNAISGQYPEPNSLWQTREAPPIYNSDWEQSDGDRRLPTDIGFPACPYQSQVAQVMNAYIEDARRFRQHRIVLPPDAAILEPLDTVEWTSARNGYTDKLFEVVEIVDRPFTLFQEVLLRERDPSDYDWDSASDPPEPPSDTGVSDPTPQPVAQWAVTAASVSDGTTARRPALRLEWTAGAALDAQLVKFEVRVKGESDPFTSGTADRAAGATVITSGILPEVTYEARGRYVLDRPTEWSDWLEATTGVFYLTNSDFAEGIQGLFADAGIVTPEILSELPTTGNFEGRIVYLTEQDGAFAAQQLYTWDGTQWVGSTVGPGSITETEIADNAISTPKLQAEAITTDKIAANAITTGLLAAGAVTADKANFNELSAVAAQIGTFSSAASGERVEIEDDRISIYNASDVLVARFGRLT